MPGSVHIVTRVTKSGKRYDVRYRRGGRGYHLVHAGSFKRRDVAKERERLVGGFLARGLDPREEFARMTAAETRRELISVAREWLGSRIDLSDKSIRVYRVYLDSIDASPLAKADPARITPGDVRAQVARWIGAGLAPKSTRERLSVLRQVLDFADVEPNPARHRSVRLPATIETELTLPSAEDILALGAAISTKYRPLLVILEQTGMRVGEAVSLERDDIDVASLRFRVKAINRKGRRGARRPRFVPVPSWLMEVIATSLPLEGRVFHDVTADGLRSAMRDVCENERLTPCTPHRLRHRRISLWHFQGVPARELADRAGHARPSMSLDVYSHVIVPDEVEPEALKRLLDLPTASVERPPRDAPVMYKRRS